MLYSTFPFTHVDFFMPRKNYLLPPNKHAVFSVYESQEADVAFLAVLEARVSWEIFFV